MNPLEAAGRLEFFVKLTPKGNFPGESTTQGRTDQIPAIRFYSNVSKAATGHTKCEAMRFTKVAGNASPAFLRAVNSGEKLNVRMEFVDNSRAAAPFVTQTITIDNVRVSKFEQGIAPPEDLATAAVLEEVSLEPLGGGATITVSSRARKADGSAGNLIVSPPVSCTK